VVIKGRQVRAREIVAKAADLRPFFKHSGGEVTAQPDFAAAVLAGCRAEGVHTAIETAGQCAWKVLDRLVKLTDLVLYDLKIIDEALHRRYTGVSNRRILANGRRLAGRSDVWVRVPLIPHVTDTEANIRGITEFVKAARLQRIAFLPCNPSAAAKYEWLGRKYPISAQQPDEARVAPALRLAAEAGLQASVA